MSATTISDNDALLLMWPADDEPQIDILEKHVDVDEPGLRVLHVQLDSVPSCTDNFIPTGVEIHSWSLTTGDESPLDEYFVTTVDLGDVMVVFSGSRTAPRYSDDNYDASFTGDVAIVSPEKKEAYLAKVASDHNDSMLQEMVSMMRQVERHIRSVDGTAVYRNKALYEVNNRISNMLASAVGCES